jgi:predicted anti-sigma-YlaC factor YlaD
MTLSDYLDGDLAGPARVQLQMHLAVCPSCGRTYRTLVRTLLLYRAYANARPGLPRCSAEPGKGRIPALD